MREDEIRKVSVFDFDGTLMDTLSLEIGKILWFEKTGTKFPHVGWWSKPESLDLDILPIKPFADIENLFRKESADVDTYVSLCTGRIIRLKPEVDKILGRFNFVFDEVVLNGDRKYSGKGMDNDTLAFKVRYLGGLQKRFPNLEEIEMWDDRVEHHVTFVQWGKNQNIKVKVHLID
jgi:hypothetical protein